MRRFVWVFPFAAWCAGVGALLPRHEPWFDETHAWMLARGAGFLELFTERLRYEGTPGLWHALLWPLAHAGLPFETVQILGAICAAAGALLVFWFAPLPWPLRLLAPFDPVVWDRRRFELFWGWAYRFEAYTPALQRKLGYYALPLLWRDRIIGWANASVNNGELRCDLGYVVSRPPRDSLFKRELRRAFGPAIAARSASARAAASAGCPPAAMDERAVVKPSSRWAAGSAPPGPRHSMSRPITLESSLD